MNSMTTRDAELNTILVILMPQRWHNCLKVTEARRRLFSRLTAVGDRESLPTATRLAPRRLTVEGQRPERSRLTTITRQGYQADASTQGAIRAANAALACWMEKSLRPCNSGQGASAVQGASVV